MMATGTAISGMRAERQFCRNSSTTTATRMTASQQRLEHLADRFVDERRGVVDDGVIEPVGKALLELLHLGRARSWRSSGRWSRATGRSTGPPTACRRACRSGRRPGRPVRCWRRRAMRTMRPSSSVLRIMSANCSASISRPSVVMVYWKTWPGGHRRLADLARPPPGRSAAGRRRPRRWR